MSENMCLNCFNYKDCGITCSAMRELHNIWSEQNDKDKIARIRNLKRKIGEKESETSEDLRKLGDKIIKKFPEFSFIKEMGIKIGYVISQERKQGEKVTYADCRKVTPVYKAWLPYDFIITFYERNTGFLNDNQLKVLMLHELKHIGVGVKELKITPHDIEDFKGVINEYGIEWDSIGKELPDILE